MNLDVKKGYLISKFNYDVFDEVISFLTNEGELINCFSSGSRKINSKNGRNLFFGSFIEFEFFRKHSSKLNKLKKAVAIRYVDSKIYNNITIKKINILISKFKFSKNVRIYLLYQEILALIMLDKKDNIIFNYFFIKFIGLLHPIVNEKKCLKCGSLNICAYSFSKCNFLCNLCFNEDDLFLLDFEISLIKKYIDSNVFPELSQEELSANSNIYKKIIKKLIEYKHSYA